MATKVEIKRDLAEWGYDKSQYDDLEWNDLQAFYNSAKDSRAAEVELAGSGAEPPIPSDSESEGEGEDEAPVEDEDEEESGPDPVPENVDEGEDLDIEAEPDVDPYLKEMRTLIGGDFVSKGEVRLGGKIYRLGDPVSIKRGARFSADERTADYLQQHRFAVPV